MALTGIIYSQPELWPIYNNIIGLDTFFTIYGDPNLWKSYELDNVYLDLLRCINTGESPHYEFTNTMVDTNIENLTTFTNHCKDPYLNSVFEQRLKVDPQLLYADIDSYNENVDKYMRKTYKEGEIVNYVNTYPIDDIYIHKYEHKIKISDEF